MIGKLSEFTQVAQLIMHDTAKSHSLYSFSVLGNCSTEDQTITVNDVQNVNSE